jgi:hypothetical protein
MHALARRLGPEYPTIRVTYVASNVLARERGERPDELVEVEGAAHWRRC